MTFSFALAINANADYYDYFTVERSDGIRASYISTGLMITFSGSNMIVESDGVTATYDLNTLSKMYFGNSDVTAIRNHPEPQAAESCEVYDLQGRRVAAEIQLKNLQNQLPKGVYIMKKGETSTKITVK